MSGIEKAAEALKMTAQTVRLLMEQGAIDIGYVVRHKKRRRYIVVEELLQKELEKREGRDE